MTDSNIWLTSDPHFFHTNIIKYCDRPFADVDEMNEVMIERWNKKVNPKHTVIHTGDFFFSRDPEKVKGVLDRLNGTIILVTGNHENRNPAKVKAVITKRCSNVHRRSYETVVKGHPVTFSHFPHLSWDKSHYGSFNIHGHCHGSIPFDPSVRRVDVGVDCWDFSPVNWDEIYAKLIAVPVPKLSKTRAD